MPIPTPNAGESRDDFFDRCMANPTMTAEFPDAQQRGGVCASQWDQRNVMNATAASPVEVRVLQRRDNGSGVVETPIIREHDHVDFSKTASGGPKDGKISRAMLRQMADNFALWPQPVRVGVMEHNTERADGPAFGRVVSVALREIGGLLYLMGEVFLSPPLFHEVVDLELWLAFSMEADRDPELPTAKLDGWVLTGGVYTNKNATDTVFRIAATTEFTARESAHAVTHLRPREGQGEAMSKETAVAAQDKTGAKDVVSLTFHESKLAEQTAAVDLAQAETKEMRDENKRLRDKLAVATKESADAQTAASESSTAVMGLKAKAVQLEAQLKGLRSANETLQQSLTEAGVELEKERRKNLSGRVTQKIKDAIDAGIPPAVFDGHEANPADWLTAKFGTFEAFETTVDTLVRTGFTPKGTDATASGHEPKDGESGADDDGKPAITTEQKKVFDRLGLKGRYLGVETEEEARKRHAEAKAKDKAD